MPWTNARRKMHTQCCLHKSAVSASAEGEQWDKRGREVGELWDSDVCDWRFPWLPGLEGSGKSRLLLSLRSGLHK